MKRRGNHSPHVGLIFALVSLMSAVTLSLGTARVASAQTVAPSWTYTGSLNIARIGNSATLLPNGKVLVAGGSDSTFNGVPFNSVELYDPATGTWSLTGNLNVARAGHTATLLPNGKVLVAGGSGECVINVGCSFHNSTELYDPATGVWSYTGSLNTVRAGHTATLLPNGKVLVVAGGKDTCIPFCSRLNSAELYDPATGTWSITGSLSLQRSGHTATMLPNGKVLVAAGFDDSAAELYDPDAARWSRTGSLNKGRSAHTATLLSNGNVLVTGGIGNCDTIDCYPLNGTELYNPATGTWSVTGNLNSANGPTALLSNGKVIAVGGDAVYGYGGNSTELYDPADGTWSLTASLNTSRTGHTITPLPNGKVLVVGGSGDNTAELYNPGTNLTPNHIDDTQFFVRQHYRDFLNREPDPEGLAFWTNEITLCGGEAQCVEVKRINDSASFFLSIEFQETGYLVYRFYKASYSNLPNAPVPIKLAEFLPDTQEIGKNVIVTQAGWEHVLENNKQAFAAAFVQRERFVSAYPTTLSPDAFVDAFFTNAGVTPSSSDRALAIAEFGGISNTADAPARARALRRVAENTTLAQQEFNRAFVLMEYFGYLRRNPNDAPEQTLDFQGYDFWLTKLNSFNGNFIEAEMVKAFLSSSEYRHRFGP